MGTDARYLEASIKAIQNVQTPGWSNHRRGDTDQCALAGVGPEKRFHKSSAWIQVSPRALPGRVNHGHPLPVILSPANILCPSGTKPGGASFAKPRRSKRP